MKKKLLCATALVLSLNAHAENDAAWMRYSAISPDGQQIAFSYKGPFPEHRISPDRHTI